MKKPSSMSMLFVTDSKFFKYMVFICIFKYMVLNHMALVWYNIIILVVQCGS